MTEQNIEARYWKGSYTKEQMNEEKVYVVETIKNNSFVYLGTVTVKMKEAYNKMDATMNIKDNMPSKFARKQASVKFPNANPLVLMPIEEWKERYGELPNVK